MKIFPAIDILDGKVVRLLKGDYGKKKNYTLTPIEAASKFYGLGANYLHVVDLDGAKSGKADNAKIIEQIVKNNEMFVEVGGGIRDCAQIEKYIDCGASRVILGTAAVENFSLVEMAVEKFSDKIAVGVDAKDGKVAINGWREITAINSLDFCKSLKAAGVNNVIYTDISRDGMMSGTNIEIYKVLCQTEYPNITASGGISSIEEIVKLKELGVYGAILGKALYEGAIDLKVALIAGGEKC